ncbi:MAG TPA: hypothetical protein DCL75_02325 [Ktedonobacter sp.]|nr:hypothetical protein [Ktedonobacter sp.]
MCNQLMKPANGHHQMVVGGGKPLGGEGMTMTIGSLFLHIPRSSMENLLEQSERREELRLALATLPELDRYLIYQRYFKFASTEELAAKTGLTRHAVDTRLWRARKSLREALKEHAHEYERI